MNIKIWAWPESDHALWCDHCNGSDTFQEARERLVAVIADLERQGLGVDVVTIPVKDMLDALKKRGLNNTPDNRALIAVEWRGKDD